MKITNYYLHTDNAKQALEAIAAGLPLVRLSTDLNLSEQDFAINDQHLVLDADNQLSIDTLKSIVKKTQRIYLCHDGAMTPLEDRSTGYYKLVPTAGAPLLEISGVKMHISKGTDPFTSASAMAQQAVRKGDKVLDCCSGLGYAAIAAHRLGASEVLSIELSPEVMGLRALNPWSNDLGQAGIVQRQGSSYELISTLPAASFDSVIHDPRVFPSPESYTAKNSTAKSSECYAATGDSFTTLAIHTSSKKAAALSMESSTASRPQASDTHKKSST